MKRLFGLLILATVSALGISAYAGYKTSAPVVIDTTGRIATGALGSARNSADSNQYISCTQTYDSKGLSVLCAAVNASGTYRTCTTTSTQFQNVLKVLSGDSYLYFVWDANGTCVAVEVDNDSKYEPKQ